MPNDCRCFVTITGNPETIKLLLDKKLDFDFFVPTPEGCEDPVAWRYENWGTKWSPHEYKVRQSGQRGLRVAFDTAWTPPSLFFEKLLKIHPELWIKCEWHEEGGFAGVWVGFIDKEGNTEVKELIWNDMCLEEEAYVFS